jgi:allantoinase
LRLHHRRGRRAQVSDDFQTQSFWKSSFDENRMVYVQKSSFGCARAREPAAWPAGSPSLGDLAARRRQAPEVGPKASRLARRAIAEGRVSVRDYLASRPVVAEVEAIGRAIAFAAETGCALHVVHVSSARGVALVAQARARGVDVTCETCPHYLVLDEDDAERLGAAAKCAPPLRPADEREALWAALQAGDVDLVATDHSPAPAALKEGDDFFAVWGGIAGAQTLLALLYSEGVVRRGVTAAALSALLAATPARRFGLAPGKGALAVGADADVALVDPSSAWTVSRDELLDRHRLSPFVGRALRGRVVRTILRGRTVARDGRLVGAPCGRVVRRGA